MPFTSHHSGRSGPSHPDESSSGSCNTESSHETSKHKFEDGDAAIATGPWVQSAAQSARNAQPADTLAYGHKSIWSKSDLDARNAMSALTLPINGHSRGSSACLERAITGSQLILDHSSVHTSLLKYLGSISKRPARFSSSHNMAPIAFLGACFWVDGQEQS